MAYQHGIISQSLDHTKGFFKFLYKFKFRRRFPIPLYLPCKKQSLRNTGVKIKLQNLSLRFRMQIYVSLNVGGKINDVKSIADLARKVTNKLSEHDIEEKLCLTFLMLT